MVDWTPEQLAHAKRWLQTWRLDAKNLERIRRKKIRELDTYETLQRFYKSADFTLPPPKPWSGLVEQQDLFKKAYRS